MATWILIVAATALGGALLLWRAVSQTKHVSEEMLDKYGRMLSEARAERIKELEEQASKLNAGPTEVT